MNVDPEGHAWWEWLVAAAVVVVCAVAAVATAGASLVVSAALAGAAVGGGVSVASQAVDVARNGGDFSWGKFAAGAATGAAIGMLGAGAINVGLALANSLPQAGGLLATTAGTTVGGAISTIGKATVIGAGLFFSWSGKGPKDKRNNQSQNKEIDYLAKKYKINKDTRKKLHSEITGQGFPKSVVEEILRDLLGLK